MPEMAEKGIKADVIVVDPPRRGCDEKTLDAIIKASPDRIVYVSCNPATLARDLRYLEDRGYKTEKVQAVDMFPHTSHVECVTLMSRQ
jgi:23S rRNA (uracil1939-C5)-methyltransferase